MRNPFLILLFIFCSPHVKVERNEYLIRNNDISIHVYEYSIINITDEAIYTWIDYNSPYSGVCNTKAIIRFFYDFHDGLNLATLLTDNVVLKDFRPKIGVNFIKRLLPQESFKYIGIDNNEYQKYVFYISDSDLKSIVGAPIRDDALYNGDYVIISEIKD